MKAVRRVTSSPSRLAVASVVSSSVLLFCPWPSTAVAETEPVPEAEVEPSSPARPAKAAGAEGQGGAVVSARLRKRLPRGWTSRIPPTSPEETSDADVAEAIRTAPPAPPPPAPYEGRGGSMRQARKISRLVTRFYRFRSAIALGTWHVDASHAWRIRPTRECRADLRKLGVRVVRWEPDPDPDPESEAPEDLDPAPAPVIIKRRIKGVRFAAYGRDVIVSCELASRLPAMAEVLAEHEVTDVVIASSWRPAPRTSFHTMGLGLDIPAFRVKRALPGPDGSRSKRLSVKRDFVETPHKRTCDPALFDEDSELGGNERGRTLLSIACKLFESGVFSSVLTPNYNPGHRDHFHIDARPDDPRVFIR